MIVWILLGFVLGLAASKVVSTTGEGTVVDILLGMVGAVIGGWIFTLLGGGGATGFNIDTVQSAGIAASRRDHRSDAVSCLSPSPHVVRFGEPAFAGKPSLSSSLV